MVETIIEIERYFVFFKRIKIFSTQTFNYLVVYRNLQNLTVMLRVFVKYSNLIVPVGAAREFHMNHV